MHNGAIQHACGYLRLVLALPYCSAQGPVVVIKIQFVCKLLKRVFSKEPHLYIIICTNPTGSAPANNPPAMAAFPESTGGIVLLVTSLLVMGYVAAHSSEESKSALFVVALAAMTTLGVDLTELSIGCLSMVWAYYCTVLPDRLHHIHVIPDAVEGKPKKTMQKQQSFVTFIRLLGPCIGWCGLQMLEMSQMQTLKKELLLDPAVYCVGAYLRLFVVLATETEASPPSPPPTSPPHPFDFRTPNSPL